MFSHALTNQELQVFAPDYAQARQRLLAGLANLALPAEHLPLSLDECGPNGEALSCDVVWLGPRDAQRVLVTISATHGVEGFVGSAIQLDSLARWQADQAQQHGMAHLLIHTLNPWGFAWLRRCDQAGIDLNRNFVDFTRIPSNEGYRELADAIVPEGLSWAQADQRLAAFQAARGQRDYELAVSGGQYEFPEGLFFGGRQPSQARRWVESLFEHFALAGRDMAVVDIHSGLGPYGYGELICDHPLDSAGLHTAQRWYGDSVTMPEAGTSSSVPKSGLLDYAWHERMSARSCYITLEFGTYSLEELFNTLRQDHLLHRRPVDWHHPDTQRVKAALRRQFYPDQRQWQELTLARGRQVLAMAAAGLAEHD